MEGLVAARRILLTGPDAPDGDSLCACLALRQILRGRGLEADVAADVPWRYRWLPGAAGILANAQVTPGWSAVVVLDGDRHRLAKPVSEAFHQATMKGLVDHHATTRSDGYTHVWLQPTIESTCGMIARALEDWGASLDTELATLLYAGMVFDTGGFRYSNTTAHTHELAAALLRSGIRHDEIAARILAERRPEGIAAMGEILATAQRRFEGTVCVGRAPLGLQRRLGVIPGDLEGIADALVHQVGVTVSMLLIDRPDSTVKVSLRSRGTVDVSAVAQQLVPTGGGHAKAAGAKVAMSLAETEERLCELLAAVAPAIPGDPDV